MPQHGRPRATGNGFPSARKWSNDIPAEPGGHAARIWASVGMAETTFMRRALISEGEGASNARQHTTLNSDLIVIM